MRNGRERLFIVFLALGASRERGYLGLVAYTSLRNPYVAALAGANVDDAERVEEPCKFPAAFQRPLRCKSGTVADLNASAELITQHHTVSRTRAAAIWWAVA
jgi:hypothetical protein